MAGIKELTEALNAAFDLAEQGIKIKKEGLQSSMGDIFKLYTSISAAATGANDIATEAQDLDAAEIQEITKLIFARTNKLLILAGIAENSKAAKALKAAPKALALAAEVYEKGKDIYGELNAE